MTTLDLLVSPSLRSGILSLIRHLLELNFKGSHPPTQNECKLWKELVSLSTELGLVPEHIPSHVPPSTISSSAPSNDPQHLKGGSSAEDRYPSGPANLTGEPLVKKNRGAQKGHQFHPHQFQKSSLIVKCEVAICCPCCSSDKIKPLRDARSDFLDIEIKEFDPNSPCADKERMVRITYEGTKYRCNSCTKRFTNLPKGQIDKGVLFGFGLKVRIVAWKDAGLSYAAIRDELDKRLHDFKISHGMIVNNSIILDKQLGAAVEEIKEILTSIEPGKTISVDETPVISEGKHIQVVTQSNEAATYLAVVQSRKGEEIGNCILEYKEGVNISSDEYAAYRKIAESKKMTLSFCLAHQLRGLGKALWQNKNSKNIPKLIAHLQSLCKQAKTLPKDSEFFSEATLETITPRLDECILEATENGWEQLLKRMHKVKESLKNHFRWVTSSDIPTTNNLAEQSFRFLKVEYRRRGSFRKTAHLHATVNRRSIVSTIKKQADLLGKKITQSQAYTYLKSVISKGIRGTVQSDIVEGAV